MANGNLVSGGSGYSQYKWQAVMDVSQVASTNTSVTYRVTLGYTSYWAINVHGNGQIDGGAGWNGSLVANGNGYWQRTNVATSNFTVSRTGSAYTKTFSGRISATGGYGNGTSYVSASVTVPQRVYDRPKPPKNFAVKRVSDTSQSLTWAGDYTDMNGATPWGNVRVNRADDGGGRVNIAVLNWSAVNYSDNSTKAGHRYDYDVESTNPAGTSVKAGPLTVYTTPVAPSRVVAAKTDLSRVELTLSGHSRWWDSIEVDVTSDAGKTWAKAVFSVRSGSGSGDVVLAVTTVPAGTVRYRVRLVKDGLASAWAESQQVVTITPPMAPTIARLADVYAVGSTVKISWTANHPDGSAQTSAQVEVTGPEPATVDVGSEASASIDVRTKGAWGVRVRTKGLHESWGAWSSVARFNVAITPRAWFSAPSVHGAVIDAMPMRAAWEVSDETGVSSQSLSIASGGTARNVSVGPSDRSAEIAGLDNNTAYTLTLTVRGGSGLTATATRNFVTDWRPPARPTAQVDVTDGLACSVTVIPGEEEGAPGTVALGVSRVLPDGSALPLGSGLDAGQSVIDRLPPLNTRFHYRVTATAASGSTATSDVPVTVDSQGMEAFNFGHDGSSAIVLGLNARASSTVSHGGEWFHFATGPDEPQLPSFYPDGTMDASGDPSYIVTTVEEYRAIDAIRRDPSNALCWYRDHWGGRRRVLAQWRLGYSAQEYGVWDVSASITEEAWEEPSHA